MSHCLRTISPLILAGLLSVCPTIGYAQPNGHHSGSLAATVVANSAVTVTSNSLEDSILRPASFTQVPTWHCGHVIDLLMTNRMRQNVGIVGTTSPVYLPYLSVGVSPGDLELICVNLVCPGGSNVQPAYQLTIRNNGQLPIGDFCISAVAVLGRIDLSSPSTTLRVTRMEAGEQVTLQIQLPVTAMSMAVPGQLSAPFDTLVVAVDSFDDLMERNELNNVLILKCCDVQPLVVATAAVTEAVAPADAAPSIAQPGAAVPTVPPVPETEQKPASPLDKIDLDNLELN